MRTTLLIASAAAIAACGPGAGNEQPSSTPATTTTSTPVPAAPFFEVIGHNAENAYDYAKTANWAAARASVDSLSAALRGSTAQDTAGQGRNLRESIAGLDSAVARRSRAQGVRAANHLTELGALLAAAHNPPVPAAVTMLDYYGRELEIGAEGKDAAGLSRAATGIRTTWTDLRPQVVARGGSSEAARFDRVVADVTAARTPAQYAITATPVLDEVDALEAVFMK